MVAEEFARDSYENLLFSIARFKEYTSHYPTKITVVGFEFKKPRFTNLHRAVLNFPLDNFGYFGIDPPQLKDNPPTAGEAVNAGIPFTEDPHGCTNKILVGKRRERNPFRRTHPYTLSCPELYNLLTICSRDNAPESIYYNLPWSPGKAVSEHSSLHPSLLAPSSTSALSETIAVKDDTAVTSIATQSSFNTVSHHATPLLETTLSTAASPTSTSPPVFDY